MARVFVGARVVRGPDWQPSRNDDGGEGGIGTVLALSAEGYQDSSSSSNGNIMSVDGRAIVRWENGNKDSYCCGYADKFEIKVLESGSQDSSSHSQRQGTDTASGSDFPLPERVSVGCLVQVSEMETDVLESLQSHLGSSLAEVTDIMYHVGEVRRIGETPGSLEVYYRSRSKSVLVHEAIASVLPRFSAGTRVALIRDKRALGGMMLRLGDIRPTLERCYGVVGEVIHHQDDNNVLTRFNQETLLVHPGCLVDPSSSSSSSSKSSSEGLNLSQFAVPANIVLDKAFGGVDFNGMFGPEAMSVIWRTISRHSSDPTLVRPGHPQFASATRLFNAVSQNNVQAARSVLTQNPGLVNLRYGDTGTTVAHAAFQCDIRMWSMLLEFGCDFNKQDIIGNSPLSLATTNIIIPYMKMLLEYGVRTDCTDIEGNTPLHGACLLGCMDTVELLLTYNSAVDTKNRVGPGNAPIHAALVGDHDEVVQTLLDAGASISTQGHGDFTPPQLAAELGALRSLKVFLRHDPTLLNRSRTLHGNGTLLHLAARKNQTDMLLYLLQQPGCDIELKDSNGATALWHSVHGGGRECVEQLLAYGASVFSQDNSGNTVLSIAIGRQAQAVVPSTMEEPLVPVDKDPPHLASRIDKIQQQMPFDLEQSNRMGAIACFLAAQGSDIHHMNHSGVSPYSGCPNKTMAQLLSQHYQEPGLSTFHGSSALTPLSPVAAAGSHRVISGITYDGGISINNSELKRSGGSSRDMPRNTPSAAITANVSTRNLSATNMSAKPATNTSSSPATNMSVLTKPATNTSISPTSAEVSRPLASPLPPTCRAQGCQRDSSVVFRPCGHKASCRDCCFQFNLCGVCSRIVERRLGSDGNEITETVAVPSTVTTSQPSRPPPRQKAGMACVFQKPRLETSPRQPRRDQARTSRGKSSLHSTTRVPIAAMNQLSVTNADTRAKDGNAGTSSTQQNILSSTQASN